MPRAPMSPEQRLANAEAEVLRLLAIYPMPLSMILVQGHMQPRFNKIGGVKTGLRNLLGKMERDGKIESFERVVKQHCRAFEANFHETAWRLKPKTSRS